MKIKRVFLIVLDSVGIGALPDAADFGDEGANTLRSVVSTGGARVDNLCRLGLGNIDGLDFLHPVSDPMSAYAAMSEASMGKDTTVGHWEIAGHVSKSPLPTFPEGFSEDILDVIRRISGRELLCNKPYSGTAVIDDYGQEATERGALIVYTSADSVLQLAANTEVVPLDELYRICGEIRAELQGAERGVGRIIARPFISDKDGFKRTADRRDYSIEPPCKLLPEAVKESGLDSIAVGKITDIFAGVGFTEVMRTHSNREGMEIAEKYMHEGFHGLCFVNLVDFDMLWGHRRDTLGYANGLSEFDSWLGRVLPLIGQEDALIITADHGCDPCFERTTDHTREYTPLLIYSPSIASESLGIRKSFADIGATVAKMLVVPFECDGREIELKYV